ncbi:MAG: phosphatase PAP2 family protein [Corynebacteriales bacterium]|nr:phosphatase PAP2 family protein [Mycobacteriales bacterium]
MHAAHFDADWYRDITEFADGFPSWLHPVLEIGTDAGQLIFAVLFVVTWWRARRLDNHAMALSLLAPVVTVIAYLVSETSKSVIKEERPCRTVHGVDPLAPCPEPGDWSFPSNHATIAGACACALAIAWPYLLRYVVPFAVILAGSRVFVGAHYPHDVVIGLILGAVVVAVLMHLLVGPVARLVGRLREHPRLRTVLISGDSGRHRVLSYR